MTAAALPVLWFVNRDDDAAATRPDVAAVGLSANGTAVVAAPAGTPPSVDPMGDVDPVFLSGTPVAPAPAPVAAAVGASEGVLVATAQATFRRAVTSAEWCWYNGVSGGETVTVVNPANGRSVACRTTVRADGRSDEIVLHPDLFWQLAELTEAPVDVEIRQ